MLLILLNAEAVMNFIDKHISDIVEDTPILRFYYFTVHYCFIFCNANFHVKRISEFNQVKMQLITAAYFREGDFNQVSILEEAFHNLNACLVPELLTTPEAFVGKYKMYSSYKRVFIT